MFNYGRQRHISHLLLIDTESVATMEGLVRNAGDLFRRFCEIAGISPYGHYTLVLVFPKSRTDLAGPAAELDSEMKQLGAACSVHAVADSEMVITRGKAGLLACSLWLIAGAILVNDKPISPMNAESLLSLANHSAGIYPIDEGLHAAMIGNQASINPYICRLSENHNLRDLLEALSVGDEFSRSVPKSKKKWWHL